MPVRFAPSPKTILLCDYSLGGFRSPEMVKRRPAVVLAGRLPRRDNLATVVPLSGTESHPEAVYQCRIDLPEPLPAPFAETAWWVKADMIATVGLNRLDFFRTGRAADGARRYLTSLRVSDDQFALIRECVRRALGLNS